MDFVVFRDLFSFTPGNFIIYIKFTEKSALDWSLKVGRGHLGMFSSNKTITYTGRNAEGSHLRTQKPLEITRHEWEGTTKHATNPFRSLLEGACTGLGGRERKMVRPAFKTWLAHAHGGAQGVDVAMSYWRTRKSRAKNLGWPVQWLSKRNARYWAS